MSPKARPMIAIYLGATKKKPIVAVKLVQDPTSVNRGLPVGEPVEMAISLDDEGSRLVEMLAAEPHSMPEDYEAPEPNPEHESLMARRRRIAVVQEAFGKLLLYPSAHHPGGGGYGSPREGVRGDKRMTDSELVKLARSL